MIIVFAAWSIRIRTAILQNVVFCACSFQPCVVHVFSTCYEASAWPVPLGFVFRRSPLFAAFARNEAVKRKAKAKDNSPDSQEPIFGCLVAAKDGAGRIKVGIRYPERSGAGCQSSTAQPSKCIVRSYVRTTEPPSSSSTVRVRT
jgi:hypothetical protein